MKKNKNIFMSLLLTVPELAGLNTFITVIVLGFGFVAL